MKWITRVFMVAALGLVGLSIESAADSGFDIQIIPAAFSADYVGIVVRYVLPEPADLHLRITVPVILDRGLECYVGFERDSPPEISQRDLHGAGRTIASHAFVVDVSLAYSVTAAGVWNAWIAFPREQIVYLPDIRQIFVHALIVKSGLHNALLVNIVKSRVIAVGDIMTAPQWHSADSADALEKIGKWRKPSREKGW